MKHIRFFAAVLALLMLLPQTFAITILRPTGTVRIETQTAGRIHAVESKSFRYGIYDEKGKLVAAASMLPGDDRTLTLETGTYIVRPTNLALEGYTVESTVNGMPIDDGAQLRVTADAETELVFVHTYDLSLDLNTTDHIAYLAGYPDGTVRPKNRITRGEVASIFYRLLTDDARALYYHTKNLFIDVDTPDWYNIAISTLANAGVLTGYDDRTFRPEAQITRAELVSIAVQFFDFGAADADGVFGDTSGHWAEAAIDFAAQLGIVSGYGDGKFDPDRPVSRAEAVAVINRVLGRNPHDDHLHSQMRTFSDNPENTWYYGQIQEAANSHTYGFVIVNRRRYEKWKTLLPEREWWAEN